jgi:hypothetical protein
MEIGKRFILFTFCSVFLILLLTPSCKKDTAVVYPDNNAPYYHGIPKVKVQNYINRLFIDLIGREPFDAEMAKEETFLRDNDFSVSAREQLIVKLQTDTNWIEGDTSYMHAYYNRFYELCKAKLLEAVTNADLVGNSNGGGGEAKGSILEDSLAGDSVMMKIHYEIWMRCLRVVQSEGEYREGKIEISEVIRRMVFCGVYDFINMNTFNFVNATFDNLYMRLPTTNEFNAGYNMIEYSQPQILFGKSGQNKGDYINIMVNTDEFYEGLIRWMYKNLLAREPSTIETNTQMQTFFNDHNVQKLQMDIMKTDEYANF